MPDIETVVGLRTYTTTTVAALGSAVTNGGRTLVVSDSTVNNQIGRGLTAAGGGTYKALVRSNGTAWKIA